jgi:hypothetical protein
LEARHVREADGATAAPDTGTSLLYNSVFNTRLTSTRYCGSTSDYCDVAKRCQSKFGSCNGESPAYPTTMKTTTTKQNSGFPPSSCTAATVTKDPVTITKDGPTVTKPGVTVTGHGTTTTITLPGKGITVTVPVTQTQAASTITLPQSTVTLPAVTISAETVTATLPAATVTLPATTETLPAVMLPAVTLPAVTETLPAVTETLPAVTETLPAVTETIPAVTEIIPAVTETLPAVTETLPATTVTLPAETVTATATQTAGASCPTGDPIVNGGFESGLAGNWVVLSSGDSNVERAPGSSASGTASLRSRINAGNPNLPQRIVQAVTVCPGVNYQVGFSARRITATGTVSAVLYVNEVPMAGGAITSSSFTNVSPIGGAVFSTTRNTVLVRIEFTYSGSVVTNKEVLVDNVTITPIS